ncbi:hypothetical protein EXIGLDRAFT_727972 [Exidia glandulosa HHB12029]|uniref:F-box domain-containing protein n=1 Tax=Exidia glandulosa HHB12029 TaxID=1314781 RepID=A0A165D4M7_EXIGL|nr:hypothetical protein EXIGLDRAFT_727972 [Exidia glandulosa HHB12029]
MSPIRVDDSEVLQVPPALLKAIFNTDFAFLNVLHEHDNSGLAPRVPLEILEVIFNLVWDDGAGVGTLASIAQTCRAFSHHVTPTLYGTVMIHSSPTLDMRVGRFATAVTSNARLASFVRAIVIGRKTGPDAQSTSRHVLGVYTSIFRACKRLDALDTYSNETMMAGFGRALQSASSVTRLAIRELHASTWLQLLEHGAPSIRQLHIDRINTAARYSFIGILHPTFHPHVFPRLITLSGFFDHTTNEHHAMGHVYAFFAQALRAPVLKKAALFVKMSPNINVNIDQHYAVRSNEERILLWEKLLVVEIDDVERIESNIRMSILDGDSIFSFGKRTHPF